MVKFIHDFVIDEILEILFERIESYATWIEYNGWDECIVERMDELEELYRLFEEFKYYR